MLSFEEKYSKGIAKFVYDFISKSRSVATGFSFTPSSNDFDVKERFFPSPFLKRAPNLSLILVTFRHHHRPLAATISQIS